MPIALWWQFALGAALGAAVGVLLPTIGFAVAIVLGGLLAWASLRKDGDQAFLTPVAAGYLTGVLGYGLVTMATLVIGAPFNT